VIERHINILQVLVAIGILAVLVYAAFQFGWICVYLGLAAWCTVHFAVFLALRRRLNAEKRIFVFNIAAFASCFAAIFYAMQRDMLPLYTAAGLLSLHGMYSLTFLWLWSGSEGSYSVLILRQLATSPKTRQQLADQLACIGGRKQAGRIQSLLRVLLVGETDGLFYLTTLGRLAAGALKSLRWLADVRTVG
jgi:hypothetical protein